MLFINLFMHFATYTYIFISFVKYFPFSFVFYVSVVFLWRCKSLKRNIFRQPPTRAHPWVPCPLPNGLNLCLLSIFHTSLATLEPTSQRFTNQIPNYIYMCAYVRVVSLHCLFILWIALHFIWTFQTLHIHLLWA